MLCGSCDKATRQQSEGTRKMLVEREGDWGLRESIVYFLVTFGANHCLGALTTTDCFLM